MKMVLIHEITLYTLYLCRDVSGVCVVNRHTNLGLALVAKGDSMFVIDQWSVCGLPTH